MSLREPGSGFGVFRSAAFALAALLFGLSAPAAEILSGRFYTVPEKIYVNQAFDIHFELEVTSGSDVEELNIGDFPNDPALIAVGRLESTSRNRITRDAQNIDVLHFSAAAHCLKPIEHTYHPTLQCMLVERKSRGFFSQWQSFPVRRQLQPFELRALPLPEAGRPALFSGAVGTFRLAGRLSQNRVHPGDIVTLNLELAGQGWLGQATVPALPDSPLFKAYPAKETAREPLRVTTEQVLIPTSTNATEVAALRFSFFNPATEHYEDSVTGPFRLTFTQEAAPKAEEVRVISAADMVATTTTAKFGTLATEHAEASIRKALPLIVFCASAVVGLLLFLMLFGRHNRLAFLAAAAALGLGAAIGHTIGSRTTHNTLTLARRAEARFAPSPTAETLFALNPGTAVAPLEKAGTWIRIDCAGQRGWVPENAFAASDLSKTRATENPPLKRP